MKQHVSHEKPHIIAICEVKPKHGHERLAQEFAVDGFEQHPTNMDSKNGRGIIVLTHSSISHLALQIKPTINPQEVCILEIQLKGNDLMAFCCIYRSPSPGPDYQENNRSLNQFLKNVCTNKRYSHTCFVGDFNYRTINWQNWTTPHQEEHPEEEFLETLRDCYLYQHIQEPTRCRGTDEPSTIDLILTGEEAQVSNVKYMSPLGKSDHSVLLFTFNCYFDSKPTTSQFLYEKGDFTAMRQLLENNHWAETFMQTEGIRSIEENWSDFKNILLQLRDQFVPLKDNSEPSWKSKGNVPIKEDVRKLIKEKKKLHRKWIRSHNKPDFNSNRSKYNKVRNKVKKLMDKAKWNYERDICNNSKRNPKAFWKHVRGQLKSKTGIAPLLSDLKDATSLKFDDQAKANILQDQFCSVFTQEPDSDLPRFGERTNNSVDIAITPEMVKKQILSLDTNKAFGPDEVHPKLLKELVDYIYIPLATIMNKSLANGCLPEDWKLALVTPIFKKGAKNVPSNYRPVSLTSIVCKMMEKIIRKQVMSHLLTENLLSTKQFGFMNRRSTTTQLLCYLDECAEIVANGDVVDAIYFDFAKAFDTVPHQRMLKKLKCYGIRGQLLHWIEAFLTNRRQVVSVNGVHSYIGNVLSGIPQGSVLGPLLFVIYINDLPEVVDSSVFLFADDTKILRRINSYEDAERVQQDIDALEKWSNDWLLRFHPDKCHVLTLGKFSNIRYAHRYTLGPIELEHVFSEKDLGVIFDSELQFEEHIAAKVKKANSIVGLIRRSFSYLTPALFRQLYTTFVRHHLEYANAVWSPKFRKHINLIEGVQRRATKQVNNCKDLTYGERLERIGIPTLEYRRAHSDMVEVYKHLHYYDRSSLPPNRFNVRTRPSRKHQFQLTPTFPKDGSRGVQFNSFYFRTITPWNNLPSDVVNSTTVTSFKKQLNEAWKNHPTHTNYA